MDARDLARYFILDWDEGTPIGWELHERRDDPYPELSLLALENEDLLCCLTAEPETLNLDELDELASIGRDVAKLLRTDGPSH